MLLQNTWSGKKKDIVEYQQMAIEKENYDIKQIEIFIQSKRLRLKVN